MDLAAFANPNQRIETSSREVKEEANAPKEVKGSSGGRKSSFKEDQKIPSTQKTNERQPKEAPQESTQIDQHSHSQEEQSQSSDVTEKKNAVFETLIQHRLALQRGRGSSLVIKTGSSGSIHLEKDTVNESEAVETFVSRHASNLGSDQPPSNAVVSSQSRSPLRKELSITPTSATSPIPGEKPPLPRKNSMNQSIVFWQWL